MGSTFKAFTTAMALDSGVARLTSGYDATEPLKIGRFTIRDYHAKNRWLTVKEIFKYSSNIGSARMAKDIGTERQREYLARFGLLDRAPVELVEVGEPLLPTRWGVTETLTVGYGHGISVSPLQLAAAVAATANGGTYYQPTLLKTPKDQKRTGRQVISPQTSKTMRDLLRLVVTDGTATLADVPGYPVGGKTGTAEKARGGGYARKALISSFVGVFPALNPKYLTLILLDEPKPNKDTHGFATAGWTAAPTAGRIIARIAPMLGLEPEPYDPAAFAGAQVAAIQDDH
jgi:cell division protein FtsI (penicillin-binding protein 3)